MKKLILSLVLCFATVNTAQSLVLFDEYAHQPKQIITATGYYNFFPVGSIANNRFFTAFMPLIDKVAQEANLKIEYHIKTNYKENLAEILRMRVDLFIGCSADTYDFRNMTLIYPSVITNPISVITLPQQTSLKTAELINKKGGIDENEPFSDYVIEKMSAYDIKKYKNYDQMFEALFNKEIDFIFTGYYYGVVKITETGIENQVSLSKQPIWTTPLFICVNNFSKNKQKLEDFFKKYSNDDLVKKSVKENLIKMINDIKIDNIGVIAPSYTKEKK